MDSRDSCVKANNLWFSKNINKINFSCDHKIVKMKFFFLFIFRSKESLVVFGIGKKNTKVYISNDLVQDHNKLLWPVLLQNVWSKTFLSKIDGFH